MAAGGVQGRGPMGLSLKYTQFKLSLIVLSPQGAFSLHLGRSLHPDQTTVLYLISNPTHFFTSVTLFPSSSVWDMARTLRTVQAKPFQTSYFLLVTTRNQVLGSFFGENKTPNLPAWNEHVFSCTYIKHNSSIFPSSQESWVHTSKSLMYKQECEWV